MIEKRKVFLYDDHINTDLIIAARYCNSIDTEYLAAHCMEDLDPNFSHTVSKGDVIVAGINFGCGSSREVAPISLVASGISCIIAESFARIFYRNSINIGLTLIIVEDAKKQFANNDILEIDFSNNIINNTTKQTEIKWKDNLAINMIIEKNGLVNYIKSKLAEKAIYSG